MSNTAKLSVIIPVYNTEKYLKRCLDSIVTQSYRNLEIILVDDGSTDNSLQICNSYAKQDSRITVIHKENGGVSSARNTGMKVATGEYIIFCDSDDFLGKKAYETVISLSAQDSADIAIFGMAHENKHGEFIPYCQSGIKCQFSQSEMIKNLLENRFYTCSMNDKVFRRELLTGIKWDEKISHNEDLLFLYQVMKKCEKASYISEAYYFYCANDGSAVHSKFSHKKMSMIDVWDYLLADNKNVDYVCTQFVRVNLTTAMDAARDDYADQEDIHRLRVNIQKNLLHFIFGKSALGYKVYAILCVLNWRLFSYAIKHKRGRK